MPSMSKREVELIDQLIDRIRDATVRLVKVGESAGKPLMWEAIAVIERDVRRLLAADEVLAAADGFPGSTPGNGSPGAGKGGGAVMVVPAEHPTRAQPTELVPTSSTESAALAEALPDPVHRLACEARLTLHAIERGFAQLQVTLNRFAELRSTRDLPDTRWCYVAQEIHGLPWDREWLPYRTTDFGGVLARPLPEKVRVSNYAYWFTRNHRRLPDREEMLGHLEAIALRGTRGDDDVEAVA